MREIKFRAWIPEAEWKEEDMFYQEDQYLSSFLHRIYTSYECNHPSHLKFEVEERLMQYTGLKDKNGVEIYEGDIVRSVSKENSATDVLDIKMFMGSFCLSQKGQESGVPIYPFNVSNDIEVIGNIYENKELLEEK